SAAPGAFGGLRAIIDREHFTDEETVVEGRLLGAHGGEFLGFQPTGRDVELPFVAFYRFDDDGKLSSERVVMNLGPLRDSARTLAQLEAPLLDVAQPVLAEEDLVADDVGEPNAPRSTERVAFASSSSFTSRVWASARIFSPSKPDSARVAASTAGSSILLGI